MYFGALVDSCKLSICGGLPVVLVTLMFGFIAQPADADTDSLWRALNSGGHVALLRHALAPGTGDPVELELGRCGTQRNLSGDGRQQARQIGERFRLNGVTTARIFSSQWCRCLETSRLLDLGDVDELPYLNSIFRRGDRGVPQTQALRVWLAAQDLDGAPIVLVTHQVNIAALTGRFPTSGEMLVIRLSAEGTISVVGSIEPG